MDDALRCFGEIESRLAGKRPAAFLDYDGTLTPIAARPDLAILSENMRKALRDLAASCTVAIISGRDLQDVQRLVGLDDLIYAGSHGFDISGPGGLRMEHKQGAAFAQSIARAGDLLEPTLAPVKGTLIERKRFAVAIHYRQVVAGDVPRVQTAVDRVLGAVPGLRKTHGKKVLELRPDFDWDKGKAVLWLLHALGQDGPDVLPFFIGDDLTDEDAFRALAGRGITIFVGRPEETAARYTLDDTDDVRAFLSRLARRLVCR